MGSLDDVKERPIQHTIQRSAPLGSRDGIKSKKEHRCDLEVERYRYLVMAGSGQGTGRNQRYDAGDVGTGRAWSRALGQVPVAWILGGEVPARVETMLQGRRIDGTIKSAQELESTSRNSIISIDGGSAPCVKSI
ncbi:hypothetical protein DTO027B9_1776 [Paecilomyces variotii]|nr:hypothetical protein DTO027B9_1776 [Paecilomyces variotii]